MTMALTLVMVFGMLPIGAQGAQAAQFGSVQDSFSAFFGLNDDIQTAAAFDETTISDDSSLNTWLAITDKDTNNVGRIWTDKTVSDRDIQLGEAVSGGPTFEIQKGDSDFLIGLSVLSSASNIKTMATKPLDIVMVLDVSGSMDENLGSEDVYTETYRPSIYSGTYYALVGHEYIKIDKIMSGFIFQEFDHWELNGQTVEPKRSADDSDPNHIQFYTRSSKRVKKINALKTAANRFIEKTAEENSKISDENKQHRISIVKFADDSYNYDYGNDFTPREDYNYTQRLKPLTAYTNNTVYQLTDLVNDLSPAGATSADYGLNLANRELSDNGRADAQQVIIFFTDGEPNHQSGFDGAVADTAITNAKMMKNDGALVYTIGIFQDADPNKISDRFNAYMHGVSSNFPNATSYENLGVRKPDSDYYKAASDAEQLNQIFSDIFDEVGQSTGFPTEITEGMDPSKGGYITIEDPLGDYMQVDTFKSLIFGDEEFKPVGEPKEVVQDDGTTLVTYQYEGKAKDPSALYPDGDVNQLIVQVTKSADLKTGDVVKVQIPASLIPVRYFKADTDTDGNTTMTIDEAWPMRIFFGVSLKSGVTETLKDGFDNSQNDQELKDYISTHTENGKVSFYSNFYDGSNRLGDKSLGNTKSSFTPSDANSFYYFTEDTVIYENEECTEPLKTAPDQSGQTPYWYKKAYLDYDENGTNNKAEWKDEIIQFNGQNFNYRAVKTGLNTQGEFIIQAGSPRLTRIDDLTDAKDPNLTGTATEVIKPEWDNNDNPQEIFVYLGNNGKLDVELAGALTITKDARVASNKGLDPAVIQDKKFKFEITVDGSAGKSYKAEVRNAQGDRVGDLFDLSFDNQEKATHAIKDDETLYVYGLDAGKTYTVKEIEMPTGFTTTGLTLNGKGQDGSLEATGNLRASQIERMTFTNTYDVTPVTLAADDFVKYEKRFDRWDLVEAFDIQIEKDDKTFPMPEGTSEGAATKTVSVKKDTATGNFGAITFTAAGIYHYTVTENINGGSIAGMSYSKAEYDVQVVVTDNGDGTLKAVSTVTQVSNDDGTDTNPPVEKTDKVAVFVNAFNAESVSAGPVARKNYTDTTGKALLDGMFKFKIKADSNNPQPEPEVPGQKDDEGYYTVTNTGNSISFGNATFTKHHVGKTYTYEISEVIPTEATPENRYTVNGMTYDSTVYKAIFKVSTEKVDGEDRVKVETTYQKGDEPLSPGTIPTFNNAYDPQDLVLPSEGNGAILGSKTLTGRNSFVDESFNFTLTAADTPTQEALDQDYLIFEDDNQKTEMTATVTDLEKNTSKGFSFGQVKFTRPGTYTFNVVEEAPEDGNGMTYDRHTSKVKVVVTDENGVLKGAVTYDNGEAEKAAFINTYRASTLSYGTQTRLNLTKTMTGRALAAEEFSFAIAGADKEGSVSKDEAEAKLSVSDRSFKNQAGAVEGVSSIIFDKLKDVSFTQDDIGKTFTYTVSEVKPTDNPLGGVTYDPSVYEVNITPIDNGNGTMHTQTIVYKDGKLFSQDTSANTPDVKGTIVLPFNNNYQAASTSFDTATINLKKVFEGKEWTDETFTFTIESEEGAPLPTDQNGNEITQTVVSKPDSGNEATFGFGTITFDSVGEYRYKVTEENAGQTIKGIQYEKDSATFTISVTDDGTGQLKAECKLPTNTTFNNVYSATLSHDQAGMLIPRKTLNGRAMKANEFTFMIEAKDSEDGTVKAAEAAERIYLDEGQTSGIFTNPEDAPAGQVSELPSELTKPMVFTQADVGKVFTYEFSEIEPSEDQKLGGVTYDKTVYKVELFVTDDGDGTLTLHTKVNNGPETTSSETDPSPVYLDFVNRYAPKETTLSGAANLAGTKTLTGRALAAEEFSFKLEADDQTTKDAVADGSIVLPQETEVKNDANGAFSFGDITFKKAGDYQFKISEVPGTLGGITYDGTSYIVKVKVTDNGDGTMTATIDGEKPSLAFNNRYGSELPQEEVTKTNVSFTKQLTGRSWTANDTFTFEMTALTENAPMPANAQVTVNSPEGKDKVNFSFGEIAFTYDMVKDEPNKTKTFEYEVKEVIPQEGSPFNGMTYDTHTAKVKITVTDNGDGTMSATTEATGTDFVNTYRSEVNYAQFNTGLAIIKTLTGHDMAKDQFTFVITPGDQASADKLGFNTGANEVKSPAADDGAFAMIDLLAGQQILFTQEDVSKTYTYEIKEEQGTQGGYTYDPTVYTVTITSSDNGAGVLTVTTRIEAEGKDTAEYIYSSNETSMSKASVAFKNSYAASGQLGGDGKASIEATKVLNGRPMEAGEFNFVVKDAKDQIVTEGTHAAAGIGETAKITFDPIEYTTESLKAAVDNGTAVKSEKDGKDVYTFQYAVSEEAPTQGGVSGTKDRFTILVTVTDHNNGTLEPAVSYPQGTDHLAFENTYSTGDPITYQPNGQKKVEAATGLTPKDITGQFTFTLTADEGTPMPETTSVKNDAQGNIAFGEMEFTQDLLTDVAPDDTGSRSKTFTYRVEETGTVPGVTNDPGAKTFSLTLTDDGKGHLTLTSDPEEGTLFTFVNTYSVTPVESRVTDQIVVEKSLVGRELEANEFSFELLDEADQVVATGTNDADGKVTLTPITYDQPGTHTYKLHEVKGEAGFGVQYDERVYTITTKVSDQGDGTLKVEHQIEGDQITFENVYESAATSVQLTAAKVLQGRDLKDGEFTFQIKDDKDQVVAEAHNDAEGRILFDAIELKEAGERTYTISEVGGNDKTIAYDVTSYKVKVIVTDDLKGHLVAEVQADEAPIFTNSVIPQEKPQDPPKPSGNIMTGIQNHLGMITAGFLFMVIAILATTALIVRRRNH